MALEKISLLNLNPFFLFKEEGYIFVSAICRQNVGFISVCGNPIDGFDIGSTQSFHSVYSTFYCLKGGRQRGEKTAKTGCKWNLTFVPDETSDSFSAVRIKECVLEHNHELHPDIYSVFNMTESSQELIRSMRNAKIEPRKVIQVMESLGEEELTATQITN